MSQLFDQLKELIKSARLAKDAPRLKTLSTIQGEIEAALKKPKAEPLTDDFVVKHVSKCLKTIADNRARVGHSMPAWDFDEQLYQEILALAPAKPAGVNLDDVLVAMGNFAQANGMEKKDKGRMIAWAKEQFPNNAPADLAKLASQVLN